MPATQEGEAKMLLSETKAIEMMRERRRLMQLHTGGRVEWFIVPGGQVSAATAANILARPDVQPFDDGLFPGVPQTYRAR
jgi:hypothetical protein